MKQQREKQLFDTKLQPGLLRIMKGPANCLRLLRITIVRSCKVSMWKIPSSCQVTITAKCPNWIMASTMLSMGDHQGKGHIIWQHKQVRCPLWKEEESLFTTWHLPDVSDYNFYQPLEIRLSFQIHTSQQCKIACKNVCTRQSCIYICTHTHIDICVY